jgi:hypothetical protein
MFLADEGGEKMNRFLGVLCVLASLSACGARPVSHGGNDDGSTQGGNGSPRPGGSDTSNGDDCDCPDDQPDNDRDQVEIFTTLWYDGANGDVSLFGKGEDGDMTNWIANSHWQPIDVDHDGFDDDGDFGGWTDFTLGCGETVTLQCYFVDSQGRSRWCAENDPDNGSSHQLFGSTVWINGLASRLALTPNGEGGYNSVATRICD